MFNKKLITLALASGLVMGTASVANADDGFTISGNVALTSDYRFRGISQSDESIAIQGGFDFEHESGFYLGAWASSVDFDTNGGGYDGSVELDYYGGFSGSFSDDVGFDIGYIYYDYPGDDDAEGDLQEVYASISFMDLTVGGAYSDDYYAETGKFYYVYADYGFSLPSDFGLSLHVGYNSLEDADTFLSGGADSYVDYSIGISKEIGGVELSLAWVDTDLDKAEVFDTDWGEGKAVFTISKSL